MTLVYDVSTPSFFICVATVAADVTAFAAVTVDAVFTASAATVPQI
jgi:hypothetical protein